MSGKIYAEYEEVLSLPRLQRPEEVVAGTLQAIRDKSLWVRPTDVIRICSDPDDDIFLECAQAAPADSLVTGNLKAHEQRAQAGDDPIVARRLGARLRPRWRISR